MKLNQTLNAFRKAAKSGEFIKFTYQKAHDDTPTKRIVRAGSDIAKRMNKQGTPIKGDKGRGCWLDDAEKFGKNSMIVRKNGKTYVRATDCTPGKEIKHKIFLLSGISIDK